jgi:hypothetical protein
MVPFAAADAAGRGTGEIRRRRETGMDSVDQLDLRQGTSIDTRSR